MNLGETNKFTILIADDNKANLGLLYNYLILYDFTILLAQDGKKAFEIAKREIPDLILLDIIMPEMDGFEVCRELKSIESTKHIPVIFITALADNEDKLKGFEMGGVDYITKPLQHEEVLARVRAQLTLKKQQEQLRELNSHKDKLLSIIAHDLKTPFNALLGYSDYLEKDAHKIEAGEIKRIAKNMNLTAKSVYDLLENLLQWSRVQTGNIKVNNSEFTIYELFSTLQQFFASLAEKKEITLNVADVTGLIIETDKNILQTVLRNIIDNAIKYTSQGGTVSLKASEINNTIVFSVKDNGVGISEDNIDNLFSIEKKKSTTGTAQEQGTGLGLVLCKDFVDLLGGQIRVDSKLNEGTTFHISIRKHPPLN